MEAPDAQPELETPVEVARARRAVGLIALSVLAIIVTAIAYLHPFAIGAGQGRPVGPAVPPDYHLSAVDFVSPSTGWFVATFDTGRFVVLNTQDAGATWTRQLSGLADRGGVSIDFFDASHGIVAILGAQPLIFRTSNGGRSWSSRPAMEGAPTVLSMSFADMSRGWLLVPSSAQSGTATTLYRTLDGGLSWVDLGSPVTAGDQAFGVRFTDGRVGWLDSLSSRPYVYRTTDAGLTWRQVALPAPRGGWQAAGQFFVAAQPTQGVGVVAAVANFAPTFGRSGIGATVVGYPPLTVRTFDGGVPVDYSYGTFVDMITSVPWSVVDGQHRNPAPTQTQAPNQVRLGSLDGGATWTVIAPPSAPGAIGYSDSQNWWWIGSGAWSTSSDGGTTWTPYRNVGVLQPLSGSLQVLDARDAWFGAMAGTRAVLERTQDGGTVWEMVVLPPVAP